MKYNFRTEHEGSGMPSLAVAAYVELPTGETQTGLGSGLADVWVYGIVQKTLTEHVVLHVNGGYVFTGNTSTGVVGITAAHRHIVTTAASLVRAVTERLTMGAEITAAFTSEVTSDREQLQILVGGHYEIRPRLTFDVGVVIGHFAASPRAGLQLGFSLDLPR